MGWKHSHLVWTWLLVLVIVAPGFAVADDVAESAEGIRPILVGSTVPDVQVRTVDGEASSLPMSLGNSPAVLIFYRAGWCPYCSQQLSALREIAAPLAEMGVRLIGISGDTPERLQATLEDTELDYTLLSDHDLRASKAFGLAFHVSDEYVEKLAQYNLDTTGSSVRSQQILPVPAVFVVNADKVVTFSYVNPNYRVRCDPEVILAAARSATRKADAP